MFWESSALIPILLADEDRSTEMIAAFEGDPAPVTWWATPIESHSALARAFRDKRIDRSEAARAVERLHASRRESEEITPTEEIRARAIRLLAAHRLRAGDALQLAAALYWCEEQTAGETFVCLDRRLRDAARREGFTVLPENL